MRLVGVAITLLCAAYAQANPITYSVTVDSTAISGVMGSLDFNFNPGPLASQAASVQILTFSSNGTLRSTPTTVGNVIGVLPTTLAFDNGSALNDYFQGFTFGSALSFDVSLYGPALTSPDGVSTSGSTFAFSMFSDALGGVPVLTTDLINGFAFTVDVNLDGTTTATSFLAQTSPVPEPSSLGLLGMVGVLAIFGIRRLNWNDLRSS